MDEIYLLINIVIYLIVLIAMIKKYSLKNVGVLYFLFYTIIAVLAFHLFTHTKPILYSWDNINPFALLYQQFFIALFCFLLAETECKYIFIKHSNSFQMNVLYILVIFFSLIDVVEVIKNFYNGMIMMSLDDTYGAQLYSELNESMHMGRKSAGNYISVISNVAKGIAPLLMLFYLTNPQKNKYILFGLVLSSLMSLMFGVSIGSRFIVVHNMLNLVGGLLFLLKYYSTAVKKWLRPIALVVLGVFFAAFTMITFSRANNQYNPIEIVENYAAQSILYFGSHGFNNGETREGERILPLIKSVFVDDVARSYNERLIKFKKMEINERVFVSFVGDCVFDFGILGAAVFLFLIYLILTRLLKNSPTVLRTQSFIIIYICISLLNGFHLWPYPDYGGNLLLISLFLLYIYTYVDRKYCKTPE